MLVDDYTATKNPNINKFSGHPIIPLKIKDHNIALPVLTDRIKNNNLRNYERLFISNIINNKKIKSKYHDFFRFYHPWLSNLCKNEEINSFLSYCYNITKVTPPPVKIRKIKINDIKNSNKNNYNSVINEMQKLISYLGTENVIISIMENGDSTDKTREKLEQFLFYLNTTEIPNRIIMEHEIDDPRINASDPKSLENNFISNLRIQYYAELRNRCLDFIYQIPNINFSNTKVIFFNDIIFEFENIINLLSTNNEDYDAVCGLDFYDCFYDSWVSIDLSGYSLRHDFPFFVNKEGQDLVINHKPIRVFSCWNGVMAFTAEPLKDKKIQFRYELHEDRIVEHYLDSDQKFSYESECTYFHIDLFSLGYTKTFINPDVRVAYLYEYYSIEKDGYIKFNNLQYFNLNFYR